MRTAMRALLVVIGIAAALVAQRAEVNLAAAHSPGDSLPIASVLPARGAVVGVAHPVVVRFRGPVTDRAAVERALKPSSKPPMTGHFEWPESDVAQWVPDRYWPSHSTVALSVGGLRTEFKTGPVVLGVADITNHTFTVSIDGVAAQPAPPVPAPHHRAHFGETGVLPASMGRPAFPTPVGTYSVLSKDRAVKMDSSSVGIPVDDPDGYLLTVDYAVRITNRGLFVHSAPWAVSAMGAENVSHGCISLSTTDAEWYFNTVNIGDPVLVQEGVAPQTGGKEADDTEKTAGA